MKTKNLTNVKLGRLPKRHDNRTLQLKAYLDTSVLPPPPTAAGYSGSIAPDDWGMMLNDTIGDCAIAGPGHKIKQWTDQLGNEITIADKLILKAYSAVSGYNPKTGTNDNGCNLLDVLNYWRKTGIGKHKIEAYAAVDVTNHTEVMQASNLFEGLLLGANMPVSVQSVSNNPAIVWDVPKTGLKHGAGRPGSWGGHCIVVVYYDPTGLKIISWGQLYKISWAFFTAYIDECYAILSPDYIKNNVAPNGFNITALEADLKIITK